jgi:16S rRNA (guanine527-N7)-methyltransferase
MSAEGQDWSASLRESGSRLQQLLSGAGLPELDPFAIMGFENYLGLLLRWNARTNLTAVRHAEGILRRHFVECIAVAKVLPPGIGTLLDFGSGAGFPGIPVAICRPEIAVTLAESQHKKAAFLREVASLLGLTVRVFAGRAETLAQVFDCVTMRAVDRMNAAVVHASSLLNEGGLLAVMTTSGDFPKLQEVGSEFEWGAAIALPGADRRILRVGTKRGSEMFHVEH